MKPSAGSPDRWASRLDRVALVLLYVGAAAIPLLFWPWSIDTFVAPKQLAARAIVVAAALAAGGALIASRSHVRLRFPDWALAVFLMSNIVAWVLSVDRHTSLMGEPLQQAGVVAFMAAGGAYAVARLTIGSVARLRGLCVAVVVGATGVAAYGLLQVVNLDPLWHELPDGRLFSLVGQSNWLGAYLVVTIPVTLALMPATQLWAFRAGLLLSAAVQALVLAGTLSRASWLGFVTSLIVGSAALVSYHWRHSSLNSAVVLRVALMSAGLGIALLLTVAWVPALSPSQVADRAASAVNLGAFDIQQHLSLWRVAAAITADHPVTGTGPDTYGIIFPDYRDRVLEPAYAQYLAGFRPESPHNVYLAHAAGAGLLAAAAYLAFAAGSFVGLATQFWRAVPGFYLILGIMMATAGHLVTDAFMTMDVSTTWLLWALLGAAITVSTQPDSDSASAATSQLQ
jgi:O-antigen ligase